MIAHVAAAGEQRGRVVVWLPTAGRASSPAIEAAMQLARAFGSEVESLFVEDKQLFDLAQFPFARQLASGEGWRSIAAPDLERELRFVGAALQRQVAEAAKRLDIPCRARTVRDEPLGALAKACAENGPWNVVAIAQPFAAGDDKRLREVFASVSDTTGVLVAGASARNLTGPVVAAVERFERLVPMVRAAERLARAAGVDVKLMLVSNRPVDLSEIEEKTRLLLGEGGAPALDAVLAARGDVNAIAAAVRRHKAGLVLAQYGGLVVSGEDTPRSLADALPCPLLVVR
jgi:nucleotide-binding universal stress UspA family protein